MTRSLLILGATGSIGQSTLDVVRLHSDRFRVAGLSAFSSAKGLEAAIREFDVPFAALADSAAAAALAADLADTPCRVFAGQQGIIDLIAACGADFCVSAIVGSAGLAPTLAAVEAGMDIALANKETLVAAGHILTEQAAAAGVRILPVDSEHSAIFQCIGTTPREQVRRLIITASGGPLRGRTRAELASVTPTQALAHPTWSMGAKITIDSATLANKGLEIMEAHWLFGLPYDNIAVLVHPQSLVHGLVEFVDGTMLAQVAAPDMRAPIQHALFHPERLPGHVTAPDLAALGSLAFAEPDREAFPMLELGYAAGRRGGTAPAVYSAANEEAVRLFLAERLGFLDIADSVAAALAEVAHDAAPDLRAIMLAEAAARASVQRRCSKC